MEGGQEGELHITSPNSPTPTPAQKRPRKSLPLPCPQWGNVLHPPASAQLLPSRQRPGAGAGPRHCLSICPKWGPRFHQFFQAVLPRLVQTHTLPLGCLPTTAPSLKINPSLCTTCLSLLPSLCSACPAVTAQPILWLLPGFKLKREKGGGPPAPIDGLPGGLSWASL